MFSFRFYSHIIPLVSLRIYQLIKDNNTINIKIFKLIIVIAFYMQLMIQLIVPMKPDPAADIGKKVGIHINKYWEDGSLIALATAGSTPFYAPNNRYIDMLGLLDTTISKRKVDKIVARFQGMTGHSKGDGKYILSRKPDYIIVGPAQGTKNDIHFLSDYELLNSEEFNNKYVMQIDTVRELNDTIIFTYFVRN